VRSEEGVNENEDNNQYEVKIHLIINKKKEKVNDLRR
jgi:hypothetical protein